MENRITERTDLEKTMVVVKHTRRRIQRVVLASDPYEKMEGEWFVNVAPVDDPQNIETIALSVYGIGVEFTSNLYWLELVENKEQKSEKI